jgi:ribosomal protein S6
MKNRYEGLFILNVKGSEETAKDMVERIEKDFAKEGAQVETVQRLERRRFSYVAGPLDSGYYVNFIFRAEPASIGKLKARFKLDEEVYRQHYKKLNAKSAVAA